MKKTVHRNQSGIVSFMVVMVIMIVLTLIVLAFARLVRREQTQTLDRQLNSQAFYAAESGVNDARDRLQTNPSLANAEYNDCDSFITAAGLTTASRLDGPTGTVSYSCLLVDASPDELNATPIPTNQSVVWPLQPQTPTTIERIELSWEAGEGASTLTGCPASAGSFPGRWPDQCRVGVIRVELVPFSGPRTRNDLITQRGIAFIQPRPTSTTQNIPWADMSGDRQGERVLADCDGTPGPRRCTIGINLSGANMTAGYIRIRSIYRSSNLTLRAYAGSPDPIQLVGSQAEIDVTGRASDILKRIKTSVSLQTGQEFFPEFALQSLRGQCKRMDVSPTGSIDVPSIFDGANSPCNPQQVNNN